MNATFPVRFRSLAVVALVAVLAGTGWVVQDYRAAAHMPAAAATAPSHAGMGVVCFGHVDV